MMDERDKMIDTIENLEDQRRPKNNKTDKIHHGQNQEISTNSLELDESNVSQNRNEQNKSDKKKGGIVSGFASFFLTERDINK